MTRQIMPSGWCVARAVASGNVTRGPTTVSDVVPLELELDYGEDLLPERLFDGCIADL
jgi:hypothetical protein